MNDLGKIAVIAMIGTIAYLYLAPRDAPSVIDGNVTSNNVPWYLNYNYPAGFTGGVAVMPNLIAGQQYAYTKTCEVCSIFPTSNTGQL